MNSTEHHYDQKICSRDLEEGENENGRVFTSVPRQMLYAALRP